MSYNTPLQDHIKNLQGPLSYCKECSDYLFVKCATVYIFGQWSHLHQGSYLK